jgi:hypothetical protein
MRKIGIDESERMMNIWREISRYHFDSSVIPADEVHFGEGNRLRKSSWVSFLLFVAWELFLLFGLEH